MTVNNDFLISLESAHSGLSKRQRILAEYILNNSRGAAYMTAASLALHAGVSEPTVVRFAAALGYEGYQAMQGALRESLRQRMTTVERIEEANGRMSNASVLDSVLLADAEKITSTLRELDRDAFERSVDMLLSAGKIYIIGMRSAAMLAQFMNYYLRLIFDGVVLVCPSGGSEMFEQLINLTDKDTVFAISFPRYSRGTVKAVEFAHNVGAGVIVLTDRRDAPVAACADTVLTAKSEMASFVDSLVAPLSIINAIIAYIGKKREGTADIFSRLENIWHEYQVYSTAVPDSGIYNKTEKDAKDNSEA